ncbi:MAG: polysaccharide deacetylase family protein [Haloarculaceae archaeon]
MSDANARLALVFDDGYATDDEQIRPVLREADAPACFAIVPRWLGDDDHLTADELQRLADEGNEVVSHGRHHRFLQAHRLTADAAAGDERLALDAHVFPGEDHGVRAGDTYEVTDGERSETVTVADAAGDEEDPRVELAAPLEGAYAAGEAVCRPSQATIEDEIVGVRAAFADLGYDPDSFVFPYDAADPRAWRLAADTYDAVANAAVRSLPNRPGAEPTDWRRYYLETTHQTRPEVGTYLDALAGTGGVGILAGHSDWDSVPPERVAWTIRAARERGIAVTTLRDAAGD